VCVCVRERERKGVARAGSDLGMESFGKGSMHGCVHGVRERAIAVKKTKLARDYKYTLATDWSILCNHYINIYSLSSLLSSSPSQILVRSLSDGM
jgi:hypothetical protein